MASKALVVGAYQRKLEELAALPEVERLTAVVPPSWQEPGGRRLALERAYTRGYDLRVEPIVFNGSFHLFFWPRLGRVLRETRPDVVHLDEEPYNLATALGVAAASRLGARPLFFTWQNLLRRYPPPFHWLERYVYARCPHAILGNHDAGQVLRAKGYRGAMTVIPQFGVDPDLFAPGEARRNGPPTIGYVARLVEEKGVRVLLDALAGLPGDWRLHVVADGPLAGELRERLARGSLQERVTWERSVPSTEMPARLRRFDLLVLPSLTRPHWKEQFGRVLVEAMACGVAVVGSTCGEIPNVVGEAGVVVPEGDASALRAALLELLGDPERRRELGERGRARVLAHYTHGRIARRTVEVYRSLVRAGSGSGAGSQLGRLASPTR